MAEDENNADKKAGQVNKILTQSLPVSSISESSVAKTATVISSMACGTQVSSSPSSITSFQLHRHFISTPLGIRLANSAMAVPVQNVPPQENKKMAEDENNADKKAGQVNKILTQSSPVSSISESSVAKTATVISSMACGTQVSSSPSSITGFQLHQHFISTPLGIRLANSAMAVPVQNVPPQGNNVQVPKQNVSMVNTNPGAGQLSFHPRNANPGFPQAIPISTTLIGQPVALQRFQTRGQSISVQRLPTGPMMPISSQQILRNGTPQTASKVQLTRQVVSPGGITNLQAPKSSVVSTIVGTNHVGYRVPSPQNQQMTVQRIVSPVVAQQAGGMAQSQMVSNPTNLVQGPGSQVNSGSLHGSAPLGTTILAGQQFTIQPRPQVTLMAGSVSSPLTLTVTSISPGAAILSSSSSAVPGISQPTCSQVQQVQQFIQRPGVVISQPSVLGSGIPVVLPRGTLTLTSGRQQVLQGTMPRIIQRPLMSPTGQVTMHLPSVVGPVIKTPTFKPSAAVITTTALATTTPSRDLMSQVENNSSAAITTMPSSTYSTKSTEDIASSKASSLSSSLSLSSSSQPSNSAALCSTSALVSQAMPSMTLSSSSTGISGPSSSSLSSLSTLPLTSLQTPINSFSSVNSETTSSEKPPTIFSCVEMTSATDVNGANVITVTAVIKDALKSDNNNLNKGVDKEMEKPVIPDSLPVPVDTKPAQVSTPSVVDMSTISVLPSDLTSLGAKSATFPAVSETCEDPPVTESSGNQGAILTQGFIDSNLLEWNDKIGTLPGTDMKFKVNEFGVLELVEESSQQDTASDVNDFNEVPADENGMDDSKEDDDDEKEVSAVNDPGELSEHEDDPICCCVYCGRYGYKSNFRTSGRFCSQTCAGKKNLHRKQSIMSRIVMGMKKGKKKLQGTGDNNVSNGSVEDKKNTYFDWEGYLAESGAVGAPKRLFKEPFPTSPNGFKLRMRLEGIDPKHQALFCVLSIAEMTGYRLRLHFDGYSECYDFWVNANSPFIFPVGWAEKNGKTLQPPKGISISEFNWTTYLKQMRAVAAPKHLFTNQPTSVTPSAFRANMKLEAVDKKDAALVCVAAVADTLGDKVLIHFDGWDDVYDYWCDITSPNIHPVGWCKQGKKTLSPPPDYHDIENFTWDRYLVETKASGVPSRAFKSRSPMGFETGMKLEVTDKRNPILIRVASVKKVKSTRLLIHFDGWDNVYDYWVDDDNPDLHPPNWCMKTGHPIQIPTDKENIQSEENNGGCPTKGCKGIGHMKGAKYAGHHSEFGCPYSSINMSKDTCLADRLGSSRSEECGVAIVRHDYHGDIRRCPTPGCNGLGHVTGKFTSHHCVSGCPLAEKNLLKTKQEAGLEPRPVGRPGRGRKRKILDFNNHGPSEKVIKTESVENLDKEVNLFHASVHESVFQSDAIYPPPRDRPLCWNDHAKLLPGVHDVDGDNVGSWSVEEVADFILQLTGQEDQAQRFKEEQIDGDSFLLLQQSDLVNFLNIKLGPAVKIFNSIQVFKAAIENMT